MVDRQTRRSPACLCVRVRLCVEKDKRWAKDIPPQAQVLSPKPVPLLSPIITRCIEPSQ